MKHQQDEYWDLVDRHGKFVCKMRRGDKSAPPNLYHATVEIIPTDFAGNILIAQRDLSKRRGGGMWEFPAGSVISGETVRRAAVRELFEETGLKAEKLSKIQEKWVRGHRPWLPGMVRVSFFAYIPNLTTAEITLQEGETSNYRIITLQEWYAMISSGLFEQDRIALYGEKFCTAMEKKVGKIEPAPEQPPQTTKKVKRIVQFGSEE